MGEAFQESSPCMPHILSVEQQKPQRRRRDEKKRWGEKSPLSLSLSPDSCVGCGSPALDEKKRKRWRGRERGSSSLSLSSSLPFFTIRAGVCSRKKRKHERGGFSFFSYFSFSRGRGTKPEKKQQKTAMFFTHFFFRTSFTDLSAAGLPAKLKHITQRRKRKQP